MISLVEVSEVVQKFMDKGMHITPDALDVIADSSDSSVEKILQDLNEREDRPTIVTDGIVSKILSSEEAIPSSSPQPSPPKEGKSSRDETSEVKSSSGVSSGAESEESAEQLSGEESEAVEEELMKEIGGVEVLQDITGKSTTEGEVEDFVQLFRDRYEKLSSIIRSRKGFQNYTQLSNIPRHEGDEVSLVGLVNVKRKTRKQDAWIVELEDPTGKAVVYVKDFKRNEEIIESVKKVVTDEVIGVKAKVPDELRSGNRNPLVWGNEISFPDVPVADAPHLSQGKRKEASGYAALISDLHVGSSMFLPEVFGKFLDWLKGKAGNKKQREMAEQVKYLIIAGDLVDGIGVYPGQEKELDINNIRGQYEKVAELLSKVPDDIHIIASPGNHDAVRLAEPQPAIYSEVASPLREIDVCLVGNPVFLSIEGVKFLIYHGMGFADLISADPELNMQHVVPPMKEVLKRRHLAPIYGEPMGGRTPLAPEKEDYLVVDEVPDVLHCGHLHRYGCDRYRGVLMVNSATFQEQTIFMKRQGIVPTPGHVPVVNLETKKVKAINFA